jgi:hypothetical protein
MQSNREKFAFPTRNYPYRYRSPLEEEGAADAVEAQPKSLEVGKIYRFVIGSDEMPRQMTESEANDLLCDPFAELLLKRGNFPLTTRKLLAALDAFNGEAGDGLPTQKIFLVADGGQFAWTPETDDLNRLFRFAITRQRGNEPDLLVSSSTVADSEDAEHFLQLLAWDRKNKVYNYYERRLGTWVWAGNSLHALASETRGRGPFDSHVNGSLVMKELRAPWHNWHSQAVSIQDSALAPDDPLRQDELFKNRVGAEELEIFVRAGIRRWNRARFEHFLSEDKKSFRHVSFLMKQVLETTSVNLTTSAQRSRQITDGKTLHLPTAFFVHLEAFENELRFNLDFPPVSVSGKFYQNSLNKYDFTVTDGKFSFAGDSFFAFLIPEPAFEDTSVLSLLLEKQFISPRFAACLLMIDFQNPVFSPRRKKLLRYVSDAAEMKAGGDVLSDIEERFVAAAEAVENSVEAGSPEKEFLENWRLPEGDWKQIFEAKINDYAAKLAEKSQTEEGFDGWIRLAESRRREFRSRKLAEFRLTTPKTNILDEAPALQMYADGTVVEKN